MDPDLEGVGLEGVSCRHGDEEKNEETSTAALHVAVAVGRRRGVAEQLVCVLGADGLTERRDEREREKEEEKKNGLVRWQLGLKYP